MFEIFIIYGNYFVDSLLRNYLENFTFHWCQMLIVKI
jgi:hypothetical protein